MPNPTPGSFPSLGRLRGFNLLYFFNHRHPREPDEADFRRTAEWGFNFLRLPMTYHLWSSPEHPEQIDEAFWEQIDRLLSWAERYELHLCLNFHRGPGYCVGANPEEPFDLWHDPLALHHFLEHWRFVARRYRGIAPQRLSLNLINEPPATYRKGEAPVADGLSEHPAVEHDCLLRVYREGIAAIREVDPERPIIIDGSRVGNDPIPEIETPGVTQSCRGYMPFGLSHYLAPWPQYKPDRLPTWPFTERDGRTWDAAVLEEEFTPWKTLQSRGVPVHCGEWGVYRFTPHDVALAWMESFLAMLEAHQVGWSLWNLQGPFGILESQREDVAYESFEGLQLDRAMLELLKRY